MRSLWKKLVGGAVLALFLVGSAGPVSAICADCVSIYGDEWCGAIPPNFQFCRTWNEYEIFWIPGDCGTCPGHFVRIVHQRCEAHTTCAV